MLTIGHFARLGQVSPRMLRHYDEIGLLSPSRVDPATGYRFYSARQLARLHRLMALRDLGFKLDQIRPILDEELSVDELRGMLTMRRAQIQAAVEEEQARLRRVEAHLRALEEGDSIDTNAIILKHTQPVRVAEAVGPATGYGPDNLGPVFAKLLPAVFGELDRAGVRPGMSIAHYEEYVDAPYIVHSGVEIGDQEFAGTDTVRVVDLPVARVASVVHRGPMEELVSTYSALVRWIEDSGFLMTGSSRELYHEWHADDPTRHVTELQLLIAEEATSVDSPAHSFGSP